jgi:predicted nucleotidyltransferase
VSYVPSIKLPAFLFSDQSLQTGSKKSSDIDFIVDFRDIDLYYYADNYFDLKYYLEDILKRNADLLEDKAINNPYLRQSIDSSQQQVFQALSGLKSINK